MRKTHSLALRAFKVAAIYALFGLLWILFSDQLLLFVTNDAIYLAQLQTVKGWFFIFVTAALLFVLVRQALAAQEAGNSSLRQSEQHFRTLLDTIPDLIWLKDAEGVYLSCNATFERFFGARQDEIVGKTDYDFVDKELADFFREKDRKAMAAGKPCDNEEWITFADNGQRALLLTTKMPMQDIDGKVVGVLGVGRDITKVRQAEEAIQKRLVALTQPLESGSVTFDELFNLDDVQRLQDEFANATGVASIITNPEGDPLTEPSNFTRLCNDIIRKSEKGRTNCHKSDAIIGRHHPEGPIVQPCLSGGLWDAGAGITVGGQHIANWLIGQVRDETQSEEEMLAYAREIGVDEAAFMQAFAEVPSMSQHRFEQIAQALFTLANQLSSSAYQNIQQARFINEREQAEKEKTKLESQLQQAQKMESVGRLAGGVAHDFNNMLGVILGHAELGLKRLDPTHKVCADLSQIKESAERSADLTRQLLAFARQQTVTPKVIDLNEAIASMLTMLQRLIGEDIDLTWQQASQPCLIHMDPSQIDQLLANLCVNARDAIEDTGRISIETTVVSLDAEYCQMNPEATPGEYVCLAIIDNGKGMDLETQAHIFEPFFTTKEQGKGTGLGLATVYGTVKQNNGFIVISSESGKGTTFSVYLPLFTGTNAQKQPEVKEQKPLRGQETILLVEDEVAILNITATMLEEQGHKVLKAATPGQAIKIAREYPAEIDLLMTDVIMPEMNGRELAKNILVLRPGTKRLFMSGYTADVIAHHGVLDEGVHFIQKPFSLPDMTAMVRRVLGENTEN